MSTTAVTGHLHNPDGSIPTNATVAFQLLCAKGDLPRIAGSLNIMPLSMVSVAVDPGTALFNATLYDCASVKPYGCFYRATFSAGGQRWSADYWITGASVDLSSLQPLDGGGTIPSI